MKVVVKRPNEEPQVIEVSGLEEINKIVGNVDRNGNGINKAGSDTRGGVLPGIDMYVNDHALFNPFLPENFWDKSGKHLYCGNVVFAGYNRTVGGFGVCSLTDEQAELIQKEFCNLFIL